MILLVVSLLIAGSVLLLLYQFKFFKPGEGKVHLPSQAFDQETEVGAIYAQEDSLKGMRKSWRPMSNKFKDFERRVKAGHLRRNLIRAGVPMGVLEFFAFKLLTVLALPLLGYLLLGAFLPGNTLILILVCLAIGFFLPEVWLRNMIKRRQRRIQKDLPNIIDLLNLCVSGGLDFMLAVNRVVKDLRPCDLTAELAEVYRQTQVGESRREALKNFAWRTDVPETHSFARTLIQADRMGTPMAEVLKMQSEEMRVKRFQRGEAMALKAPIKLLFPLFVFILPVVLILVAGPIIIQFAKGGMGF